jgi:hypothetical protein
MLLPQNPNQQVRLKKPLKSVYNVGMMGNPTTDNRQPTTRKRAGFLFLLLVVSGWLLVSASTTRAQEVDLLWQGETYTSPFYKGRSLWSDQARVNLVAIPHGLGNSASLDYKWTKNGTILGNINGVGKNTLVFSGSVISRPQTVKVDILSSQKTVLASASVTLVPASPILAIYENNPLYGFMFHKETGGGHEIKEKEVTFTAFPFFFSAPSRANVDLTYEWRTNAGGIENKNSVTYRAPDDTVGKSDVRVNIRSTEKILQNANKSFLVEFGKQ